MHSTKYETVAEIQNTHVVNLRGNTHILRLKKSLANRSRWPP